MLGESKTGRRAVEDKTRTRGKKGRTEKRGQNKIYKRGTHHARQKCAALGGHIMLMHSAPIETIM